ncbi:SagB/ThcOx family dehydrogenase [Patescibacteria group bacterium]
MKTTALTIALIGTIGVFIFAYLIANDKAVTMQSSQPNNQPVVNLPSPILDSDVSLEKTLSERRSGRDYKNEPLTLSEVSQLLWAAQGITNEQWGGRTAPSAGALYPLEVYLIAGQVNDLAASVYRYVPEGHKLVKVLSGDKRSELSAAALDQVYVAEAPIDIVIAAVYERTTGKYGERGVRYVHLEAGHAGQNIALQVVRLDLTAVTIGAFDDNEVVKIIGAGDNETPLYIIPVGRK